MQLDQALVPAPRVAHSVAHLARRRPSPARPYVSLHAIQAMPGVAVEPTDPFEAPILSWRLSRCDARYPRRRTRSSSTALPIRQPTSQRVAPTQVRVSTVSDRICVAVGLDHHTPPPRSISSTRSVVFRQLREDRGESQEVVAFHAGITAGTLARLELGQSDLSWGTIRAVAAALSVSLRDLATAVEAQTRLLRRARRTTASSALAPSESVAPRRLLERWPSFKPSAGQVAPRVAPKPA